MSENVIQTSFAAGELAPSLYARVDMAKYHSGCATMRNFFVDYRSGASSRPGTEYMITALKPNQAVRLIGFQQSSDVSYVIEFGDRYCRFISNGAPLLEDGFAITAITRSVAMAVTAPGAAFSNGDVVQILNTHGMPQVAGRFFLWHAGQPANFDGTSVHSSDFGVYTGGGIIARVYTIVSPYNAEDLALLKFSEEVNTLTLTHPLYPVYILRASAPTTWNFILVSFGTTVNPPTALVGVPSAVGTTNYAYLATSVNAAGEESEVSAIADVLAAVDIGNTAGTISLTWTPATGAVSYNLYKSEVSYIGAVPLGVAFGFIGSADSDHFIDSNIVPDFSQTPPIPANPFAGNDPSCNCSFQQRHYYAGSLAMPTTFWASQPGLPYNMNISNPTQADDAITGTIVGAQVNIIKSLIPMPGGLIVLTSKGAWQISSGSGVASTSAVTPINATASPQAYNGSSDLPPIVVNYDILYVQAKGSIVRDLSYNLYANIYTGTDISVLSNHLFYGKQITEWAYAEEPFKIIWCVRSDGNMLSLTFVKEQEIYGWARHDTLGLFQSVASVTEGTSDATYVVVKRFLQGQWTQTIERLANRIFPYGSEDAWSVDCGLRSSLPLPRANLIASSSSGEVTFTVDSGIFTPANVGSTLRMNEGIATITEFLTNFKLAGTWLRSPTTLPNSAMEMPLPASQGQWSLTPPSTVFYGLDYLEGETVSINADGGVVRPQVVVNGSITLQQPATKVTVGLGFRAQLQTLDLDTGDPTIQGKRKKNNAVTVRVAESRGLKVGHDFDHLTPIKEMTQTIPLGSPIPLTTGDERIVMDPLWDVPGRMCFQLDDPMPSTILGLIPEITIGDTK